MLKGKRKGKKMRGIVGTAFEKELQTKVGHNTTSSGPSLSLSQEAAPPFTGAQPQAKQFSRPWLPHRNNKSNAVYIRAVPHRSDENGDAGVDASVIS